MPSRAPCESPWPSRTPEVCPVDRRVAQNRRRARSSVDHSVGHTVGRDLMIRWCGFHAAAPSSTKVLGVRIRLAEDLRIYRPGKHAVRTQAYVRAERTASLWANGFTPRLQTYPGWKAPNGLLVDVWRGHPSINTVSEDLLALTKLNYNALHLWRRPARHTQFRGCCWGNSYCWTSFWRVLTI